MADSANTALGSSETAQPQAQSGGVPTQTNPAKVSGSPWEDALPIPETPTGNNPSIIGSLDENDIAGSIAKGPAVFNVPKDIEEKVGQKVPAANYTSNQPVSGDSANQAAKTVLTANRILPKPDSPPAQAEATRPIGNQNAALPQPPISMIASAAGQPVADNPIGQIKNDEVSPASQIPLKPELPLAETGLTGPIKSEIAAVRQTIAPPAAKAASLVGQSGAAGQRLLSKLNFVKSPKIAISGGILLFLFTLILLTETGLFSLGFEKIYGAIGLEKIWGGLPKKTQSAIVRSAVSMKGQSNFKSKGSMTLTIDKTSKSPITKPLLASADNGSEVVFGDFRVSPVLQAILTASSSIDDVSSDYASDYTEDVITSDSYDYSSTTDETSTDSGTLDETANSQESQADYPSYQYQGASSKDVVADFSALFGQKGNEGEFILKRVTGESAVNLKNVNNTLYVKSAAPVKFNKEAKPDQWTEYQLESLKDKIVQKDIFSFNSKAGFSAKGTRLGNEKVGKTRTYKYKLDSLEIGNSLTALGISSEMVQGISGDVWIGVRDKLLRKIDLQITAPPSSSVSQIRIVAEFYDYGVANEIAKPDGASIIASDQNLTGDKKRKADLAGLAESLEAYKDSRSSYPTAGSLAKLNSPDNILSQALVSEFIGDIPADPKFAEGWFYAYKSDGTTFTLSTRLEDTADPEAKPTDGIYLYFMYNQ